MITVAWITLGTGILMLLVSLPLARRKIPINRFYGVRIPASFASPEAWFAINEYGGRLLAKWSWVIIATGAIGLFVPQNFQVAYALATVPVVLISVILPVMQILVFAGKRKQRE